MRYKTKPVPLLTLVKTTFYSLYQVLIAAVIVLVFFTNFPVWIDTKLGMVTAPTVYLAFILAPLPFVLRERFQLVEFMRHPYVWWCALVMVMHFSGLMRAQHFGGTIEEAAIQVDRLQKFLIAPAAAYLVYSIGHRTFTPFLCVLIFIAPAAVLYGFIDPGFFYEKGDARSVTAGRSGGPWFNPNIAAEALLIGLVMARQWVPKILFVVAFCLAGPALMATGSRAGMIGWVLLSAYLLRTGNLPKLFLVVPVLIAMFYSSVLLFVEDIISSIPEQAAGAENLLARLEFMTGTVDAEEGGGDQRGQILLNAIQETLEKPFLGFGHDYAEGISELGSGAHNLFIQLWHMHGLLGIAVTLLLGYILYRYSSGSRFLNLGLFTYIWFSIFSHNIIEHNLWFVFFAMAVFESTKSNFTSVESVRMNRLDQREKKSRSSKRRSGRSRRKAASW